MSFSEASVGGLASGPGYANVCTISSEPKIESCGSVFERKKEVMKE